MDDSELIPENDDCHADAEEDDGSEISEMLDQKWQRDFKEIWRKVLSDDKRFQCPTKLS